MTTHKAEYAIVHVCDACESGTAYLPGTEPRCHVCAVTAELRAEIARLKTEGTPGVMHEVDAAFCRLTIKERDLARTQVARLTAEVASMEKVVEAARELVYSGYDGPFMGEPVEALFHAVNALEGGL